jgi:hypothetical protein
MRMMFCVLCLAMWSGVASTQVANAQYVSNFDACVNDARQKRTDSTMENYTSFKCDGVTAQKLAARPDECSADVRPSANRIERRSRQLGDGLYLRMIWRTQVCAGMCEIRFYNDSRDPSYLCEVRRHIGESRLGESRRPDDDDRPPPRYNRRYPDYPPPRRWVWREYDEPAPYRPRLREPEEEVRRVERWIRVEPDRYRAYPREYRDDDDRDDYYRRDYRDDYRRGYPY